MCAICSATQALTKAANLCDGAWYGYPILLNLCNRAYQRLRREKIIRVGSCGAVNEGIKVRDVVIGMGACTDSKVNRIRFKDHDFAAIADYKMVKAAEEAAKARGIDVKVGNLFSAELFYTPNPSMFDVMDKYGIVGVEMEAAGIYGVAAEYGAKALAICTVSDHIKTGEQTTSEERQNTFNEMIEIALDSVLIGDQAGY